MAKRQVNKNLVGVLTVVGVLLAVGVVTIAAANAARRDPEVLARKAAEAEKSGNARRAMELFGRAYRVNQEVKYLIEVSRLAWGMGEISQAVGQLVQANAQAPQDTSVLVALLERFWELKRAGVDQRTNFRDYSSRLLEIEPKNLLALVSRAEALEGLRDQDPANAQLADEALQKALEIDPTNPRVAMLRVQREINRAAERARASRSREDPMAAVRENATKILSEALAAHPGESDLVNSLAALLWDVGDLAAARDVLTKAIAEKPDDPDLHFGLARTLTRMTRRLRAENGDAAQVAALLQEAREHVDRALQIEPGLYDAYSTRADIRRLELEGSERWQQDLLGCQNEVMQIYADALRDTVGLRTIRSVLGRVALVRLLVSAFDDAVSFYNTQPDAEGKAALLAHARRFHEDAATRFPDSVIVPLMAGQLAVFDNKARDAIDAYHQAEERAGEMSPAFARMARENLAMLYRQTNELGSSLKYTDLAVQSYLREGLEPPLRMWLNRAQVLTVLERPQEALDTADSALRKFPDDRELRRVRATALAMLGRTEDAQQALGDDTGDVQTVMTKARFLAHENKFEEAEALLRPAIEADPANLPGVTLLLQVMLRSGRQEQAGELINTLLAKEPPADIQRILRAYQIVVTSKDPEERDRKLLEVIEQIADPVERLSELFNFWITRGDAKKAVEYLDEIEKLKPDDEQIAQLQFLTSLTLMKFDKAEKYLAVLTAKDLDRAGGALYRGLLKGAQGDPDGALKEYRSAEAKNPNDVDLKLRIAQSLLQIKPPKPEEAIESLQQALEADPRNFAANKLMYICMEQTNQRQEGFTYLQTAAKVNPNDPFIRERQRLIEEEADPAKGIAWREPLREKEPQNLENLLRLAELYARTEQNDKAEQCIKDAAAVAPDNRQTAQTAALFYASRQRKEDGEKFLRDFIAASKGYEAIRAYTLLGRFYEALGDNEATASALDEGRRRTDEIEFEKEDDRRAAKVMILAELAEYYARRQQIPERIETLKAVLALLKPDETAARQSALLKIMKSQMLIRQFGEAEKAVAAYREEFPTDPRGGMAQAELLTTYNVSQERLELAREITTKILQEVPTHRWCLFTRGKVNLALRRFDEAKADLLRIKALMPTGYGLEHRFALAKLYELQNALEQAEAELRELVALYDPPNQQIALQLLGFLRRTNQVGKAQEFVNQMAARYPKEPFWPFQLGMLLKERGEHSAAVASLERALELTEGRNALVISEVIDCLVSTNRAKEAVAAFEKIAPEVVTPLVRANVAAAYLKLENRDAAAQQFGTAIREAIEKRPGDIGPVVEKLSSLLNGPDAEAVIHTAITGLEGETALRATCVLARFLVGTGMPQKLDEVERLVQTVRSEAPANSPLQVEALLIAALVAERRDRDEESVRTYEEILKLDDGNVAAMNNLAFLMVEKLNQAAEAIPYAERAAELVPNNGNIIDTLGWAYFKNGDLNRAESTLLEALRLEPENPTVLEHVGELHVKLGNRAEARKVYGQLLELGRKRQNAALIQKAEQALRQTP